MQANAYPVAIFRWTDPVPDEPRGIPERLSGDDGEQLTYESSYPAACAIAESLRDRGFQIEMEPVAGELGWTFHALVGDAPVNAFVNWTGIEGRTHNYIALQWSIRQGRLKSLFRGSPPETKINDVQHELAAALTSLASIADIRWLTDEEFDRVYRMGEPLPPIGIGAQTPPN